MTGPSPDVQFWVIQGTQLWSLRLPLALLGLTMRSGRVGGLLWAAGLNRPQSCLIPNGITNRVPAQTSKCCFLPCPLCSLTSYNPCALRSMYLHVVPMCMLACACNHRCQHVYVHVCVPGAHSLIPQLFVSFPSVLF